MTPMLAILQREVARKQGAPTKEVYPVIRLKDRALIAWYIRDRGFIQGERFSA